MAQRAPLERFVAKSFIGRGPSATTAPLPLLRLAIDLDQPLKRREVTVGFIGGDDDDALVARVNEGEGGWRLQLAALAYTNQPVERSPTIAPHAAHATHAPHGIAPLIGLGRGYLDAAERHVGDVLHR